MTKKIIVTLPAYNEEDAIGKVITDIKAVMNGYLFGILVVDDGSLDKTAEIARSLGAKVISHPYNMGLAQAFRTEIDEAIKTGADIIVHIDADGQYLPEEIPGLIRRVEDGSDLVLGSRFLGEIESMTPIKRMGNILFSEIVSHIINKKITDCQTGFRAFNRKIAKIPINSDYTYTQEQIITAVRRNLKITEVPAYFAKRKGDEKSRLMRDPFDYAFRAGINLFRVSIEDYPVINY